MNKVYKILEMSDILLEVVDARFPKDSRINKIEKIIKKKGKELIIVINKSDLVPEDFLYMVKDEFEMEFPTVYISCKTRKGSRELRRKIKERIPKNKDKVYIGVFGYPNTGKSSTINLLVGRSRAKTSPMPGFTKGIQLVKLSKKVYLIDTPGIIFPKREEILAILGSIDPSKLKNPIICLNYLLNKVQKEAVLKAYDISDYSSIEDFLIKLKEKYNVSTENWKDLLSRKVLYDWINGKIKGYWL
ncbi:MAG: GTPase [Nanopusillaceae archaeon]